MTPNAHTRRSPLRSLLALAPVLIGAPWLALWYHWDLPTPQTALYDPVTNLPQLSETRILDVARHLSEEIGYRTVGTYEHALGDAWMVQQAEEMKRDCDRVVSASKGARKLECEVWHQVGSGSHRFDMMNKRLYKTYVGLTNIIVRVSDGTEEGKAHSVLVNAHVDSTLPSPGAADDAMPVGIMMECIRVLVGTPTWEPKHAIVFLFNNAEESLQDGSHLFTTQHPIAPTVRAVINLEAAGTTGREILFQATSEEMIEAYSHVPRPFGTIFANDIFSSGFILSDTDFRQFEQYLNVTGLDMAVVGNSYLYHMRKDLVENIQPGVATNMGLNVLALLRHLTSPASPLPSLAESGYTKPSTVFFSYLGWFFVYSFDQALWAYSIFGVLVVAYVWVVGVGPRDDGDNINKLNGPVNGSTLQNGSVKPKPLANGLTKLPTPRPSTPRPILTSLLALTSTLLLTLLLPNLIAFLLASPSLLHKSMSWFSNEYSVLPLFAPPALLGALSAHLLLSPRFLRTYSPAQMERLTMNAILLLQTAGAVLVQALGVGSAAILFLNAVPMFLVLALTHLSPSPRVPTWVYALAQWSPLLGGTMLLTPVIEFFVPLTGRIGQGPVPADNIIATIVSCILTLGLPLTLPFLYRFERGQVWKGWMRVALVVGAGVAVFAGRAAFDEMHQRRVFVLWREEMGPGGLGERSLHVAGADGAPGLGELVEDIARVFGDPDVFRVGDGNVSGSGTLGERLVPAMMDEYNSDWDTLYPFSSFLTPYKIPLAPAAAAVNGSTSESVGRFMITAVDDVRDAVGGTRTLTLRVHHPGLIWTVIAFDAHVLKWNLDDNPPAEYVRHHVKESSFYGRDTWELDLVLSLGPHGAGVGGGDDMTMRDGELAISFMGIQEKGMWPGKRGVKEEGGAAMVLFEELDGWVERRTGGTVDVMLLGCVGGVVRV